MTEILLPNIRIVPSVAAGEPGEGFERARHIGWILPIDDTHTRMEDTYWEAVSGEVARLAGSAVETSDDAAGALAALGRADGVIASLPSESAESPRFDELRRRIWWGHVKLGLRRLEVGDPAGALDPLYRALHRAGGDGDREMETRHGPDLLAAAGQSRVGQVDGQRRRRRRRDGDPALAQGDERPGEDGDQDEQRLDDGHGEAQPRGIVERTHPQLDHQHEGSGHEENRPGQGQGELRYRTAHRGLHGSSVENTGSPLGRCDYSSPALGLSSNATARLTLARDVE